MEKKENELIESFIEFFGVEKILKYMDKDEIMDIIDVNDILECVDDEVLIESMNNVNNVLDYLSDIEIIDHLKERGYETFDDEEKISTIMGKIKSVCKELKPNGYIDKEDAKRLICDYIDTWMNKSF